MTSALIVFCLSCLFVGGIAQSTEEKLSSSVHQVRHFISANVGESLTLPCLYNKAGVTRLYWYKQILGHEPRPICTLFGFNDNGSFHDEFKNNPRFSLATESGRNHLKITDLQISDSATYYCAGKITVITEFAEGIIVNVKDSGWKIGASVHQSESQTIQPGGSVTLNCTVQTGTCDGEHSVYWFKDSEEAHPGLIYTHGERNNQCERKPDTQTHTCVYNLPMTNLDPSHSGTYYCAVASCGHIVFGNGTKLDIEDEVSVVYVLSGALGFVTTLTILLASSVCVISMRGSCLYTESPARCSDPSFLRQNKLNRQRRLKDNTWSECVYFSIKKLS